MEIDESQIPEQNVAYRCVGCSAKLWFEADMGKEYSVEDPHPHLHKTGCDDMTFVRQ